MSIHHNESSFPGLNDPQWVKFLKRWLLVSLAIHLVAGVMSVGFYDMDEHFQVMEFLSYKLGRTPVGNLAPEFLELDRSWMQPTLYEGIARFWMALGVRAPSVWACSMRIFSAIVGWASLVGLSLCAYPWLTVPGLPEQSKKWRERAVLMMTFLYCMPYIHARTSSENLGGSFFFLAVALLFIAGLNPGKMLGNSNSSRFTQLSWSSSLGIGCLLGLSFTCRYQMGFMILGFVLWCALAARVEIKKLMGMALGGALMVALEVVLDWRGFGVWTFAPWNYLRVAVLEGKAAKTGEFPWWYYFEFLKNDVPILGNLLAGGVIIAWLRYPTHILTLSTAPFFIAHVFLAHKEPRYLFPMVSGVPILFTLGWKYLSDRFSQMKAFELTKPVLRIVFFILLAINGAGLVVATLKPAMVQPLLHTYFFDHQDEIKKVYYLGRDPFEIIGMQMDFYRPSGLEVIPGGSFSEFSSRLNRGPAFLFYTHFYLPADAGDLSTRCELKYSVFSDWLKPFLFLPGLRLYSNKSSVFLCK